MGFHTSTKTVGAVTLGIAWLKCSFTHDTLPSNKTVLIKATRYNESHENSLNSFQPIVPV